MNPHHPRVHRFLVWRSSHLGLQQDVILSSYWVSCRSHFFFCFCSRRFFCSRYTLRLWHKQRIYELPRLPRHRRRRRLLLLLLLLVILIIHSLCYCR